MTINYAGNDLNGANMSDSQVQFAGDPSGTPHLKLIEKPEDKD